MTLIKRKKPSHNIFNNMYMEEIIQAYEKFVKKLSLSHIYYEIIPKQYQQAYCKKPFGEAFSETSGEMFSKIFSSAFDNEIKNNENHDVQLDFMECKPHVAFKMMYHYNLTESLMKQSYEQNRWNKKTKKIIEDALENLRLYYKSQENGENIGTAMLINNVRYYQTTLEYMHMLYKVNKYRMLSKNASSDVKMTFRQRDLVAKDQYINMLKDMLHWKKMKQRKKYEDFSKLYSSQIEKLNKLIKEEQSLRSAIEWYVNNKEGSKRTETLTGLTMKFRNANWFPRCEMWTTETNKIAQILEIQFPIYLKENDIQSIKLDIKTLCNNIQIQTNKTTEYTWQIQREIHQQLDNVLNMKLEEYIEQLIVEFNYPISAENKNIANIMTIINTNINLYIDQEFARRKKEIQEQNYIGQLETNIIRHVINTTTVKDIKNKKSNELNTICDNYAITNDASSNARNTLRKPNVKGDHTKEFEKYIKFNKTFQMLLDANNKLKSDNNQKLTQYRKLEEIFMKWLEKHKPKEHLKKYEEDFNTMVNNILKLQVNSNKTKNIDRMTQAAQQMTLLLNDLKAEFSQIDENLNNIAHKVELPENKYSKPQANSVKRCDTCNLYRSNIIGCTKYITEILYEKNLNRFYLLTAVSNQLSFLLHMMRTSIFRDDMSYRNQWSIKKIRKKIIVIRNQLREILEVKIDMIDFSLAEKTNVSGFTNFFNSIFMDQSNNKDMLNKLDSAPSCSTFENKENKDSNNENDNN